MVWHMTVWQCDGMTYRECSGVTSGAAVILQRGCGSGSDSSSSSDNSNDSSDLDFCLLLGLLSLVSMHAPCFIIQCNV